MVGKGWAKKLPSQPDQPSQSGQSRLTGFASCNGFVRSSGDVEWTDPDNSKNLASLPWPTWPTQEAARQPAVESQTCKIKYPGMLSHPGILDVIRQVWPS